VTDSQLLLQLSALCAATVHSGQTDTIKLSKKNRMHRILKLNLNLNKPITPYACAML